METPYTGCHGGGEALTNGSGISDRIRRKNSVADSEERPKLQEKVSTTHPDATWAVKSGPATLGYYDNYLVDTTSRAILSVQATPALFSQETFAARHVVEHLGQFGIHPKNLAADKAYGSGEFLAWLLARNIQPHIPVIDRRHQTQGRFSFCQSFGHAFPLLRAGENGSVPRDASALAFIATDPKDGR
jgi:hypothetical protein